MRWQAPDGVVWASRFEYEVFLYFQELTNGRARRTEESDSLRYTTPVVGGICTVCDSRAVAQERTYTPDIYILPDDEGQSNGYYIEAKGYLRADRRSLLRAVRKARPDVDLRLVVYRDYKVTAKHTLVSWAKQYLKLPVMVWKEKTWNI